MKKAKLKHIQSYLTSLKPTKIIKQGNAFSITEVTDEQQIEETLHKIVFKEFFPLSTFKEDETIIFSGEWLIVEENGKDEFYEFFMDCPGATSKKIEIEDWEAAEYLLDMKSKEIFIEGRLKAGV